MVYEYLPSQCDVRVAELSRLKKFRARLSVWREWLSKDEHSIWQQIHKMLWNDMVFRTINECRRLAVENPSPNVGFNGPVAIFIDQSYVANQLLAIRRLTESNARGDAITLPRLLDDMKAHADLFTRELYVCHDGLPFDPEPARDRTLAKLAAEAAENNGVVGTWLATTGPEAYDTAIRTHVHFDRLVGREAAPGLEMIGWIPPSLAVSRASWASAQGSRRSLQSSLPTQPTRGRAGSSMNTSERSR